MDQQPYNTNSNWQQQPVGSPEPSDIPPQIDPPKRPRSKIILALICLAVLLLAALAFYLLSVSSSNIAQPLSSNKTSKSSQAAAIDTNNWKVYDNELYKFKFKYPPGNKNHIWKVYENPPRSFGVEVGVASHPGRYFLSSFGVEVVPAGTDIDSLANKELQVQQEKEIKKYYPSYQQEKSQRNSGGVQGECTKTTVEYKGQSAPRETMSCRFLRNDKAFFLYAPDYNSQGSQKELEEGGKIDYHQVNQEILDTFEFY